MLPHTCAVSSLRGAYNLLNVYDIGYWGFEGGRRIRIKLTLAGTPTWSSASCTDRKRLLKESDQHQFVEESLVRFFSKIQLQMLKHETAKSICSKGEVVARPWLHRSDFSGGRGSPSLADLVSVHPSLHEVVDHRQQRG